jgi:hypothetical protein
MEFLILSKSRSQDFASWWLPGKNGYTTDVDKAGKFSAADSALIVRGSPEKDMRVPVSALERSLETRRVVHMDDASNRDELMAFDGA